MSGVIRNSLNPYALNNPANSSQIKKSIRGGAGRMSSAIHKRHGHNQSVDLNNPNTTRGISMVIHGENQI